MAQQAPPANRKACAKFGLNWSVMARRSSDTDSDGPVENQDLIMIHATSSRNTPARQCVQGKVLAVLPAGRGAERVCHQFHMCRVDRFLIVIFRKLRLQMVL